MTAFPEPSVERVTTLRTGQLPPVGPRHAAAGIARHRAPETGEIRIVAAADCAREGRHAAPADAPGRVGLRFTTD